VHLFFVNFAEKDFIIVYKHNEFSKSNLYVKTKFFACINGRKSLLSLLLDNRVYKSSGTKKN